LDSQLDEVCLESLRGCDVVVHLAAHTANAPYDSLSNCLHWNLAAVLVLFEKARLAGVQKFIVAGSCFEYGRSAERYKAIPTDAPLEPTNSYGASKAAASIAFCQWANQYQVDLEILRVFHVFGEGESSSRLWPSLRRAALAGDDFPMTAGEQIRDFMHVEAVAAVFLDRLHKADCSKKCASVFNLSSGKTSSIKQFAEYWWQAFGATGALQLGVVPYRSQEVMVYVPGPNILINQK
jgi:nucleoside-diphosphate-sugar epimerase